MTIESRYPQVGDVLIYSYKSIRPYVGVVKRIEYCRYGHQNMVFVHWQHMQPRNYNADYGYSGVNIHNLRHDFRLIRQGQIIS